jgi:hypothetical protein
MARRFEIEDTITRPYSRLNVIGSQLVVRLLQSSNATDTVSHFLASAYDHFRHALQIVSDSDMVGITIQKSVNQNDKPIGTSFKLTGHLAGVVIM